MGRMLTIRMRHEPGYVLITVAGEIDIAAVPVLTSGRTLPSRISAP